MKPYSGTVVEIEPDGTLCLYGEFWVEPGALSEEDLIALRDWLTADLYRRKTGGPCVE
jgi:hypothetical protein